MAEQKTAIYVQLIASIHTYVKEVSTEKRIFQYLQRSKIAETLQDYRTKLQAEYMMLSIISEAEIQQFQHQAEQARKEDQNETGETLKQILEQVRSNGPSGDRELEDGLGLGLSTDKSTGKEILQELEIIKSEHRGSTPAEAGDVVQESIRVTRLLPEQYKWFRETFDPNLRRAQVRNTLVNCIDDVVGTLIDDGLLAKETEGNLTQRTDKLEKVQELFKLLDSRPRDAILVRTVQRALLEADPAAVGPILNPRLS